MRLGTVNVNATSTLCVLERTSLELEARPYAAEAFLYLAGADGRITIPFDLVAVRTLRELLADAERVMLGDVLTERPSTEDTDGDHAGTAADADV